jgi:hypothetical protein
MPGAGSLEPARVERHHGVVSKPLLHTLVALLTTSALLWAQQPRRHPPASADRGLPQHTDLASPYHGDPQHLLNRIFRALYFVETVPDEVGAALPRERGEQPDFWVAGWVHRKRPGTEEDRRWFGGDGRQLPVEGYQPEPAAELAELLRQLGPAEAAPLRQPPELAVLFQHDLLRLGQRLLDTRQNAELLPLLRQAATAVALPTSSLEQLCNPILAAHAVKAGPGSKGLPAWPPELGGDADSPFREVLRKSTRLFDAERTLLWSRLWLHHPDGPEALAAMLPQPGSIKGPNPKVPSGFAALLVQGIVALADDGRPHATPVVVDLRTQWLANRAPLGHENATFTRDGIEFGIWQLEREAWRRGDHAQALRSVEPDDQDLFRDYGTLKHTTYRAQCTLCHRNSDTPEPELGGFPVLRHHAGAAFAITGSERLRLAEQQVIKLLTGWPTGG